MNIIEVKHLSISFSSPTNEQREVVKDLSFSIKKGETLGIVGESGSGKSITALALMGLLPQPNSKITKGTIDFFFKENQNSVRLSDLSEKEMQHYRGNKIAMIFQEPMTALNPVFTCGEQVAEVLYIHQKCDKNALKSQTLHLFEQVKLTDALRIFKSYPHQLSGGQKQRVMIAMAIACEPDLLIADEPTTALDVTVQKSILELLKEIKQERQLSMLFISHDLGVISEVADHVLEMKNGKITTSLGNLNNTTIYASTKVENKDSNTILKVENLQTWFPHQKNFWGKTLNYVKAVDNINFEVLKGETLGIVGESGCGKTTLGRTLLHLVPATSGKIYFENKDLFFLEKTALRHIRKDMQIIFQDPYSSLNPRKPVGDALMEPMQVHGLWQNNQQRKEKTIDLLESVRLKADYFYRYPHEFSGGERQRIAIARALASEPKFIVCDECVSALDVSIQAQILHLLAELREKLGLTYLFISHDLSVVRSLANRIMVMKAGKIEEIGEVNEIFEYPKSTYTRDLIDAIPKFYKK